MESLQDESSVFLNLKEARIGLTKAFLSQLQQKTSKTRKTTEC